ncbi:MAG: bifunctional riboflavin kinase/FAD synthetase [Proteobacteria bacterium]|nr:bifunctional riboflavin kinase/FAD synthetase [Pseudomonadota bacterium]
MRLYRHVRALATEHRRGVVAVGNFDGVHLGHRTVIGEAGRIAEAISAPWGVLSFEPHPREVFQPDVEPFRLTPFRDKARTIGALGVDFLAAQKFDIAFSQCSAESFVADFLVAGLGVRHVIAGYDFRFGHKRQGSCETLLALGRRFGFDFTAVSAASDDGGGLYSSSRARELIAAGQVSEAANILGRPFCISGRVRSGDRLGRQLGFPTANVWLGRYARPAFGVYAIRADLGGGKSVAGVANVGVRPTVGGSEPRLEAHLFDFSGDLYGRRIAVELIRHIRAEKKFDGLDALRAQIATDSAEARRILEA